MTRSNQVLIDAGQRIRDFVLSTADDEAFSRYLDSLRKWTVSYQHIARVSGIRQNNIMLKDRAGAIVLTQRAGVTSPYAKTAAADFVGVKLTQAQHGDGGADDWRGWWVENCPAEYRAHVLSEHIDGTTLLDAIFLETHGRLPADEGRAYYERQRLDGRSWGAICAEIERHATQMGH